jgi:acetylornithine deacetylase/succinyl-diaminopimelate desuccinylase-like protein
MATGIAATPFRIIEQLLARLESPINGGLLLDELSVPIPQDRRAQMEAAARVLGESVAGKLPWATGVRAVSTDPVELLVNSTWKATLAVTGADGLPPTVSAGNVLLPSLTLKLSLRLPPTCDPARAASAVQRTLEHNPPYGAQVRFESGGSTRQIYGREAIHVGCGGTIPFMGMLGERFPSTQFFITGVLGPHANAHGPNEFLHLEYAEKLTACVSLVLADHAKTVG